jgi:hypothetical protein
MNNLLNNTFLTEKKQKLSVNQIFTMGFLCPEMAFFRTNAWKT